MFMASVSLNENISFLPISRHFGAVLMFLTMTFLILIELICTEPIFRLPINYFHIILKSMTAAFSLLIPHQILYVGFIAIIEYFIYLFMTFIFKEKSFSVFSYLFLFHIYHMMHSFIHNSTVLTFIFYLCH